ncbi:unnamed protein product [Pleuronectes platessa]|uniref:Uncharacterized protein n=1 Tax=Pleuronectes platessa TaxID=8262 RepID=A0A9N7Z821_PLEPL|nr:unnamed protein product [Pleuronectes platessa]
MTVDSPTGSSLMLPEASSPDHVSITTCNRLCLQLRSHALMLSIYYLHHFPLRGVGGGRTQLVVVYSSSTPDSALITRRSGISSCFQVDVFVFYVSGSSSSS